MTHGEPARPRTERDGQPEVPGRLGDVLLGAAAGALPDDPLAQAAAGRLGLPSRRAWCVVLVDGLGWLNLLDRADLAPFLSRAAQEDASAPLQSAVPSTTSTNLAYLGTGQAGGRTRMLGYTVRNPRTGRLANLISFNGADAGSSWQPERTVFERLEGAGRVGTMIGPWQFADSPLTSAALRGAEYHPAQGLSDRVDTALGLLRDPEVDLVYLYWGELDSIGHARGWAGADWAAALSELDGQVQRLARMLPHGTGLIVTADHGMVDVPEQSLRGQAGRIDAATHRDLSTGVDLIAGEPRLCHLHTGEPEAVAARWRSVLKEAASVRTRRQAIEAGWFGEVVPAAVDLIGDVVVAANGRVAILDSAQQSASSMGLRGMHGSLTDRERLVPCVVVPD